MTPENRDRILDAIMNLCSALGRAFGCENYGYEDLMRSVQAGVRDYGNKTISGLLLDWARTRIPAGGEDGLKAENFSAYLDLLDTREKAEAFLDSMPDPDPRTLDALLGALCSVLPSLRQQLIPFAKRLPHAPGGRPRKLADPAARERIRQEIGALYAKGWRLTEAQKRIAKREGVGVATIQRIWQERNRGTIDDRDDKM